MSFGVDFSAGRPSIDSLRSAGVQFVCRYIAALTGSFNLTAAEAQQYRNAGISVVLIFEQAAKQATFGFNQGIADAKGALDALAGLGAPPDQPVFFAVDTDLIDYAPASTDPRAKLGPVAGYFDGIRSVMPLGQIGAYGDVYVIKRLFDAGLISYGWQTYAWSGTPTVWEPRAQIQQYLNSQTIGGASVDYDRALVADFGQWQAEMSLPADWSLEDLLSFAEWRLIAGTSTQRPSVPATVPQAIWDALTRIHHDMNAYADKRDNATLDAQTKTIASLQDGYSTLTGQVADLTGKLTTANGDLAAAQAALANANTQVADLTAQLADAQAKLAECGQQIDALNALLTTAKADRDSAAALLTQMSDRVSGWLDGLRKELLG